MCVNNPSVRSKSGNLLALFAFPIGRIPDFRRMIRRMVRDGSLVKLRHSRYGIPSEHNLVVGRISVQGPVDMACSRPMMAAQIFLLARDT